MKFPPHHTFALSAKAADPESRYPWALKHGFALEYTPDPEQLELLPAHTAEFRRRKVVFNSLTAVYSANHIIPHVHAVCSCFFRNEIAEIRAYPNAACRPLRLKHIISVKSNQNIL